MSSTVPAWKRIGLSVKKDSEDASLNIATTRVENADLTTKLIKKISNKNKSQSKHKVEKKPAKRIKLPKGERPPPPVKDQLTYLKQYETDRANWKFNKSKQNWILKNIKDIPNEFESALFLYIENLQGGARDRIVTELKQIIEKWNVKYEEAERKIEEELASKKEGKEATTTEETKSETEPVNEINMDYAVRCFKLLKRLTDDVIEVKGAEDEEEEQEEVQETKQRKLGDNLIISEVDV
ncbi:Uncharacterized protein JA1_001332 [Spathaspora sp. JA1]|nr:Uncharacterized protein JA1_001332 [Spathaspora sp. JA1]